MKKTDIEWTDFSSNPIKYRDRHGRTVWACVKESPGCANCYAEAIALRYNRGHKFTRENMKELTPFVDDAEIKKIIGAKVIDKIPVAGKRCFLGDMTDIFGPWVPDQLLDSIFRAMVERSDVTFQLLTKHPDRMAEYCGNRWGHHDGKDYSPPPNVWLGTSVENQKAADERIPHLLKTPAAVRFLSCEPLLGPVDLLSVAWPGTDMGPKHRVDVLRFGCWLRHPDVGVGRVAQLGEKKSTNGFVNHSNMHDEYGKIGWIIIGGESGPGSRSCNVAWLRSIVEQCKSAGVAVFCKQLGANIIDRNDAGFDAESWTHAEGQNEGEPVDRKAWPTPLDVEHDLSGTRDGYQGAPVRVRLKDKKGGDPSEWPADLRVREFPKAGA